MPESGFWIWLIRRPPSRRRPPPSIHATMHAPSCPSMHAWPPRMHSLNLDVRTYVRRKYISRTNICRSQTRKQPTHMSGVLMLNICGCSTYERQIGKHAWHHD